MRPTRPPSPRENRDWSSARLLMPTPDPVASRPDVSPVHNIGPWPRNRSRTIGSNVSSAAANSLGYGTSNDDRLEHTQDQNHEPSTMDQAGGDRLGDSGRDLSVPGGEVVPGQAREGDAAEPPEAVRVGDDRVPVGHPPRAVRPAVLRPIHRRDDQRAEARHHRARGRLLPPGASVYRSRA